MFGFGFSPMFKQPFSTVAAYTFPSGMISSYPANGSFNDTTGVNNFTAYNGVLNNSTAKLGSGGFFFDGVNDSLMFVNNPFEWQAFSYSFWMKPTINNTGILITQNSGDGYRLTMNSSNQLFFRRFISGSLTDITTSACINTGVYQHIVVTRDNTSGTKIYCNNTLVGSDSNLSATYYNGGQFILGADIVHLYVPAYSGNIDAFQVFNKALSVSEVSGLYNLGTGREI